MNIRAFLPCMVFILSLFAQEPAAWEPDTVKTKTIGSWSLVRKKYCSVGACGKSRSPYAIDVLQFDGETLRGKGYQTITTPFGRHTWKPDSHPCTVGLSDRRWFSLDDPPPHTPMWLPAQALEICQADLPKGMYAEFVKQAYHPTDSLTLRPWELRRSGAGWIVLHKGKPVKAKQGTVKTPWGLMHWDKERKIWIGDKPVIPNDFR